MTMHANAPDAFIRVIDLETTGQGLADGGVVEIGWQDVAPDRAGIWALRGPTGAVYVNPGRPISPSTSAIHHIIDDDVAGAELWQFAAPPILAPDPASQGRLLALAAHRASFEQRWCLPSMRRNTPWICTYKCALRLWPEAPTFSNQGLRYWRQPEGLDRAAGLPAHRAGPDAYVTAHLLRDMLALVSLAELLLWSAEPALLPRVPFGPYRGRAWRDLDDAALERIISNESGGNIDVMYSARVERARRVGVPVMQAAQQMLSI